MKILHVAAKAMSLGHFALPLMERLVLTGHEVEALGDFDGHEQTMQSAGFTVHPWCLGHSFNPLQIMKARHELASLLRDNQYDIIHTHCSFGGIIANPIACRKTSHLFYTQHGFYTHEGMSPLKRALWLSIEKRALCSAHTVFCVSQAELELATRICPRKPESFVSIPGAGVDVAAFQPSKESRAEARGKLRTAWGIGDSTALLLTVSRLSWDKGYREMIEAAKWLLAEGHDFAFVAAGTGKDADEIQKAIERAGIEERFILLGWRNDIANLCCAADAFVFASHREGLPIAPLEAMASGLPVVASDIPGCVEEIEDHKTGLIFRAGSTSTLVDALRPLIADPEFRRRLGSAAAQRACDFDLAPVLDIQMQLYERIAGELAR